MVREKAGKSPNPTSLAVDSQSVKTTEKRGDVYGFDGGKKVKGRRRHIVVDSLGLVMQAIVTEGHGGERIGVAYALMTLKEQWTEMVG